MTEWECGNAKDGYQCSRPAGHKGMHRKSIPATAVIFAQDVAHSSSDPSPAPAPDHNALYEYQQNVIEKRAAPAGPAVDADRTCEDCGIVLSRVCWPCFIARTGEPAVDVPAALDVERQWMKDAAVELERLTAIIEGRHEARLQPPHGQTSNRPRALLERLARLQSPDPTGDAE